MAELFERAMAPQSHGLAMLSCRMNAIIKLGQWCAAIPSTPPLVGGAPAAPLPSSPTPCIRSHLVAGDPAGCRVAPPTHWATGLYGLGYGRWGCKPQPQLNQTQCKWGGKAVGVWWSKRSGQEGDRRWACEVAPQHVQTTRKQLVQAHGVNGGKETS